MPYNLLLLVSYRRDGLYITFNNLFFLNPLTIVHCISLSKNRCTQFTYRSERKAKKEETIYTSEKDM